MRDVDFIIIYRSLTSPLSVSQHGHHRGDHEAPLQDQYMDLRAEFCESPLSQILRYLRSIVAWSRASFYISAMSRRHAPISIKLGLVETHNPAAIPITELPFELLLRQAFRIKGEKPDADVVFNDKLKRLSETVYIDHQQSRFRLKLLVNSFGALESFQAFKASESCQITQTLKARAPHAHQQHNQSCILHINKNIDYTLRNMLF